MNKDKENRLIELIKSGAVFIYPTDTVYGIGCNALDEKAVERIREVKGRDFNKPMSVIAPSKQWIHENLVDDKSMVDKYLPGRYTLILRKKCRDFLNHVASGDTLGVRIPAHWFTVLISKTGVSFITTSANLSGEGAALELTDIPRYLFNKVDVIINDGKLFGKPSSLILESGEKLAR